MVTERVDVRDDPELLAIARRVVERGEELVLSDGDRDLAVVKPLPRMAHEESEARERRQRAFERFRSTAGSWADVDVEALKARIRANRDSADRPLPDL